MRYTAASSKSAPMTSESCSEEARSRPKGFSTTTRIQSLHDEEGEEEFDVDVVAAPVVVVSDVVVVDDVNVADVAVVAEAAAAVAFAPPLPTWEQCALTPASAAG